MKTNDRLISSSFVRLEGLNIHYLAAGEGEPVVLLHGWPTSSYLWRKVMEPLARTRRVIAPDLPGFGQSDKPLDAPYTLSYYSEVLDGFLSSLGIKQTTLVLHDLGGPVGGLWAVRNPEKINRLALVDSVIHPKVPFWTKLLLSPAWIPGIKDWLVSSSGIAMTMRWGVVNKEVMTQEVIAAYQTPFAIPKDRHILLKTLQVFLKTIYDSQSDELREITQKFPGLMVPTRMIYAEKDFFITWNIRRIKRQLPNVRFIAIPNCGHFLQEDQPERLSELLVEFLSEKGRAHLDI